MYTATILATVLPVLVAAAPAGNLESRQSSSNCIATGGCGVVNFIFARGTTEPGNLGVVIGPGFSRALGGEFGDVCTQGVDYPANVAGFIAGGDNAGAATMAALARQSIEQCPGVPIVMSGYSQGAQVTSKAMGQLSAAEASNVGAVVLFGNPNGDDAVPNAAPEDTKIFCNAGDLICAGQAVILAPHLAYGSDADEAAAFVASRIQV